MRQRHIDKKNKEDNVDKNNNTKKKKVCSGAASNRTWIHRNTIGKSDDDDDGTKIPNFHSFSGFVESREKKFQLTDNFYLYL